MSSHTPTPWFHGCSGSEKIQIVVCDSPLHEEPTGLVAEVNKRICFTAGKEPMESPVAEANARLICRAVNSHALLIEALEAAAMLLDSDEATDATRRVRWAGAEACRKAVKLAKGEQP